MRIPLPSLSLIHIYPSGPALPPAPYGKNPAWMTGLMPSPGAVSYTHLDACVISPNFKDSELCDYYKTADPLDVPGRMLSSGEYGRLVREINNFNGFISTDDELSEVEEEAKN